MIADLIIGDYFLSLKECPSYLLLGFSAGTELSANCNAVMKQLPFSFIVRNFPKLHLSRIKPPRPTAQMHSQVFGFILPHVKSLDHSSFLSFQWIKYCRCISLLTDKSLSSSFSTCFLSDSAKASNWLRSSGELFMSIRRAARSSATASVLRV